MADAFQCDLYPSIIAGSAFWVLILLKPEQGRWQAHAIESGHIRDAGQTASWPWGPTFFDKFQDGRDSFLDEYTQSLCGQDPSWQRFKFTRI